jgi:hypothetical protein
MARLETSPGPLSARPGTIEAIRAALGAAGLEFTNGDQPGTDSPGNGTRLLGLMEME